MGNSSLSSISRGMLLLSLLPSLLLRRQAIAATPFATWVEGTQLTNEVRETDENTVNVAVFKKALV
jgi:hypothetical protein